MSTTWEPVCSVNFCVNACPHDAIRFDTEFENAVFDRSKLVLTLNKN